jgi:Predicted dehydrogenases and related proteins
MLYHVVEDPYFKVPYVTGPEYQLIDNEGWEKVNAPTKLEEWQKLGVDYAMHLPNKDSMFVNPQGEWNQSRIIFDNGHVEHWLNGKKILEFETWTEDWFKLKNSGKWANAPEYGLADKGVICLQDHGYPASFRNLKIKELPKKEGKNTSLFNGEDLSGWEIYGTEKWYVNQEGELACESGLDKGYGYLATREYYRNFDLTLEFKQLANGNSGVFFRSFIEPVTNRIHGWQCEVAPKGFDTGGIYESYGRGWLVLIPDEKESILKEGDWNTLRLKVLGDSIKTWLNGEPMIDIVDSKIGGAQGRIALQIHDGGGIKVLWKNINLKNYKDGYTQKIFKKAGGLALLTIIPRHVLGGRDYIAPSDQLTKGIIGVGGIGKSSYHFTSDKSCRLVAVCDVDKNHLQSAVNLGKKKFNEDLAAYSDFRKLIADPNVDVVHIATPPHWHAIMAIEAAKAGKDIWCEKPMTRTIGEGKRVMEAVKLNNRIFRLNTWFRFKDTFYGLGTTVEPLKKLIDSGLLGWPLKVNISGATGFTWKFFWVGQENLIPQSVPSELDYDMWLGPAPYKPYNPHRVHQTFRGYWDYDGGGLTDMGQHYMDPVQYFLNKDNTSPVKIEVDAPEQHPDAVGIWRKIVYTYADGCQIILEGEGFESKGDVPYIEGPKGKVYQGFRCTIPNVMEKLAELPDPAPQNTDFIECIHTRQKFALNEINGHRSSTLVNLGACALRLNRTLHFDPDKQLFIGDDAANRLIDQPMRSPWHI